MLMVFFCYSPNDAQYAKYPNEFLKKDRHGIRVIVQQSGVIGEFDFQTMLLSLVSG